MAPSPTQPYRVGVIDSHVGSIRMLFDPASSPTNAISRDVTPMDVSERVAVRAAKREPHCGRLQTKVWWLTGTVGTVMICSCKTESPGAHFSGL